MKFTVFTLDMRWGMGPILKFTKHHPVIPVGAQFIGAPPIYRPVERIDGLLADKSAMRA
jgi:hypothetical protein